MDWGGELCFGEMLAVYVGVAAQNDPHAHAALQVVIGDSPFVIEGDSSTVRGHAIVVRTLARHALIANDVVRILYVEPISRLAVRLAALVREIDVVELPQDALPPLRGMDAPTVVGALRHLDGAEPHAVDSRLRSVLQRLRNEAILPSVSEAAETVGLSPSRLRAVAAKELGVPLSTWILWRKLERATKAALAGASLTQAALLGGFSDHAHFTRTMRRMFGITPRQLTVEPGTTRR